MSAFVGIIRSNFRITLPARKRVELTARLSDRLVAGSLHVLGLGAPSLVIGGLEEDDGLLFARGRTVIVKLNGTRPPIPSVTMTVTSTSEALTPAVSRMAVPRWDWMAPAVVFQS